MWIKIGSKFLIFVIINSVSFLLKDLNCYCISIFLIIIFRHPPLPQSPQSKSPCNNICLNLLYTKTTKLKIPCICLFTKTNYSKQISNSSYYDFFREINFTKIFVKIISRKNLLCFIVLFFHRSDQSRRYTYLCH